MEITVRFLPIIVVAGVVAWLIGHYGFFWTLPFSAVRRIPPPGAKMDSWNRGLSGLVARLRTLFPGLAGAVAGGIVAVRVFGVLTPLLIGLAAFVGALIALYLAIIVATPSQASIVVNCKKQSDEEVRRDKEGHAPPFAWPYLTVVRNRGSVIWQINGDAGWRVTIEFPSDRNPFGKDAFGKARTFAAVIPSSDHPATIAGGPVVASGRFTYTIRCTGPGGEQLQLDPGFDVPKG